MDTELAQLEAEVRKEFPNFKVMQKANSSLMKAIDIFLKVITFWKMKDFMQSFITTVGVTVYVPGTWNKRPAQSRMAVLRHERIHMRQAKKYTRPLFSFLYLFFPLPIGLAYFRMKFEKEAYEETLRALKEYYGIESIANVRFRDDLIKHFTTAEYYWMWPFKKSLEKWYDGFVEKLRS